MNFTNIFCKSVVIKYFCNSHKIFCDVYEPTFTVHILDCLIQVLNMYANDGERLFKGATWVVHTASGPLMLIAGTACAIALIGAWALIGFVVLLLMIFLKVRMMKTFIRTNVDTSKDYKYNNTS